MESNKHNRHSDHTLKAIEEKIIKLIEETDDNKDKAYLLILMKINDSLDTNTNNIDRVTNKLKEITDNLDLRFRREDALLNRGRGWRDVIIWGLGTLQAVFVWGLITITDDLKSLHKEQEKISIEFIKTSSKIDAFHSKVLNANPKLKHIDSE